MVGRLSPRRLAAFTLVELLVVIAVIGVLIALLAPAIGAARAAARKITCASKIKQVALGVHLYVETHRGWLPHPTYVRKKFLGDLSPDEGCSWFNWMAELLPMMGYPSEFDAIDHAFPPLSVENSAIADTVIPIFECPATVGRPRRYTRNHSIPCGRPQGEMNAACFDYTGMGGAWDYTNPDDPSSFAASTSSDYRQPHISSITDGLSQTVLLAESPFCDRFTPEGVHEFEGRPWISGASASRLTADAAQARQVPFAVTSCGERQRRGAWIRSYHQGGAHVAVCDGSVRFISREMSGEEFLVWLTHDAGDRLDQVGYRTEEDRR